MLPAQAEFLCPDLLAATDTALLVPPSAADASVAPITLSAASPAYVTAADVTAVGTQTVDKKLPAAVSNTAGAAAAAAVAEQATPAAAAAALPSVSVPDHQHVCTVHAQKVVSRKPSKTLTEAAPFSAQPQVKPLPEPPVIVIDSDNDDKQPLQAGQRQQLQPLVKIKQEQQQPPAKTHISWQHGGQPTSAGNVRQANIMAGAAVAVPDTTVDRTVELATKQDAAANPLARSAAASDASDGQQLPAGFSLTDCGRNIPAAGEQLTKLLDLLQAPDQQIVHLIAVSTLCVKASSQMSPKCHAFGFFTLSCKFGLGGGTNTRWEVH